MITLPAEIAAAVKSRNFSRLRLKLELFRNKWDASTQKYAPEDTGRDVSNLLKKANKLKWKYDSDSIGKYEPDNVTLELYNKTGLFFEGKADSVFDGENYLLYGSKIVVSLQLVNNPAVSVPMFTGYVSDNYSFKTDEQTVSLPLNTGWALLETISAEGYSDKHEPEQLTADPEDDKGLTFRTSRVLVGGFLEVRYGTDWASGRVLEAEQDYEATDLSDPENTAAVELKFIPSADEKVFASYFTWKQNQTLNDLLQGIVSLAGLPAAEVAPLYWSFDVWAEKVFEDAEKIYACYKNAVGQWVFNTWPDGQNAGTIVAPHTGDFSKTFYRKTDFFRNKILRIEGVMSYGRSREVDSWIGGYHLHDDAGNGISISARRTANRDSYVQVVGFNTIFSSQGPADVVSGVKFFIEIDFQTNEIRWTGADWRELWFTPQRESMAVYNVGELFTCNLSYFLNGEPLSEKETSLGVLQTAPEDFGEQPKTNQLIAPVLSGQNVIVTPYESADNAVFTALPDEVNGQIYGGNLRYKKLRITPQEFGTVVTKIAIETSVQDTTIPYVDLGGVTVAEVLADLANIFFYEAGFKNDGTFFMRPRQGAGLPVKDLTDADVVKSSKLSPGIGALYTAVKVQLGDNTAVYKHVDSVRPGLVDKYGLRTQDLDLPDWLEGADWMTLRQLGRPFLDRISSPQKTIEVTAVIDPALELGDCIRLMHNTPGLPDIYADWYKFDNFPGYFLNMIIDGLTFDFDKFQMSVTLRDVSNANTEPSYTLNKFKYLSPVQFGATEFKED